MVVSFDELDEWRRPPVRRGLGLSSDISVLLFDTVVTGG
jgi:hypothetical protein